MAGVADTESWRQRIIHVASSPLTIDRPRVTHTGFRASEARAPSARRWRALGKEASLVFTGQAAAGLGAIIGVRILTGLLPPAVFGQFALSLTVVMILQYCYAGTSAAAMRFFVPAVEKGQGAAYLKAAWRMQHVRGLLAVIFVFSGIVFLMATRHVSLIPLGLAALVMAVVTSYGAFMDGLQNAARQRAIVALHQGTGSWLRLGCAALFVTTVSVSAASVLWGFAAGAAAVMASQYVFYRRIKRKFLSNAPPLQEDLTARQEGVEEQRYFLRGRTKIVAKTRVVESTQEWRDSMTGFAWPYLIWSIPVWLQLSSDRWALDWFASSVEVGIYSALCQLAFVPIRTLTQLITQLAVPILFARAGDLTDAGRVANSRALNAKLVQIAFFWTIIAVFATMMLQAPIGYLLLDPRYHPSLPLLPVLILSAGLFATAQLAEIQIITLNQTACLMRPKITVAIFACVAFLVGAYQFGLAGVAWGSVLANAVMLAWIWRINTRFMASEQNDHAALPDVSNLNPC